MDIVVLPFIIAIQYSNYQIPKSVFELRSKYRLYYWAHIWAE